MRMTDTRFATVIGRALRAAFGPGCLSAIGTRDRAFAVATPAVPATGSTHVVWATYAVANGMKDQGTHPPRALAALR